MRLSQVALRAAIFGLAAILCVAAARVTVSLVEEASARQVQEDLVDGRLAWVSVLSDGLQVILEGEAPSEADRFRAISTAAGVVDASRVIDNMSVAESRVAEAPDFALEILRGEAGISVIGLIPEVSDRDRLARRIGAITDTDGIADFLETADHPAPDGWDAATDFALTALRMLERSKISVSAERVEIAAIADSAEDRTGFEEALAEAAPDGLETVVAISAPRPVISPYTVRFSVEPDGTAAFGACAATDAEGIAQILAAAAKAGFAGEQPCIEALGAPTPRWTEAAVAAIEALARLDGGTVTLSDTAVLLQGLESTDAADFDRAASDLDAALPPVFALATDLPRAAAETGEGPPSFTATLAKDGAVRLNGPLPDDLATVTAENYAAAKFGAAQVTMATRTEDDLPQDWSVRVLSSLEALAQLKTGRVTLTPDLIEVSGQTGQMEAPTIITTLIVDKLGATAEADLDIEYVEAMDPNAGLPTPEECIDRIGVVTKNRKILFDPNSSTLTSDSQAIMDDIAQVLQDCGDVPLQIAGYTDSQGPESMNQELSRKRADAVLDALRLRRLPTASFTSVGFGEESPIADNGTSDGREANRRIEFSLLETPDDETSGEDSPAGESAGESPADDSAGDAEAAAEPDASAGGDAGADQ